MIEDQTERFTSLATQHHHHHVEGSVIENQSLPSLATQHPHHDVEGAMIEDQSLLFWVTSLHIQRDGHCCSLLQHQFLLETLISSTVIYVFYN